YTSGTTGRPKGVVYSHRSQVLHTLVANLPASTGAGEQDTLFPVVPMFHANAWGAPYASLISGARHICAGPYLDPTSLLELLSAGRVPVAMGVPTIWMGILQCLDKNPNLYDLSALRCMVVGGAAVPESMIRAFATRHNLKIVQGWGMTETSPIGSVAHLTAEL